jgi:uncharacterized protein YmfQ (DUF2313 family)
MTKDDYKQQLIALMPTGGIWPSHQVVNNLARLIDALAEELARIDARALELMEEAFPNTAVELLPDWERVAGLPGACTGELGTLQQRHSALMGVLTIERSLSQQYYIDLALRLGFVITIAETANFTWQVTAAQDVNAVYFRVDISAIGDPLVQSATNLLECVFQALKPAHTIVTFNYI